MSYPMLLVGAQTAGFALNIWQTSQANRMIGLGADLDRQSVNLRMQQESLMSSEQAVMNSEKLREVMATQATIFGARGQTPGIGSARAIQQASINAYGADERARQLNLNFRNNQLKAQKYLISIDAYNQKAANSAGLFNSALQGTSFNSLFGQANGLSSDKLNTPMGNL